jgi:protein-S-isoprenylcysteine O-methyltransferase Ste14
LRKIQDFVFSNRSYTPIPLLICILYFSLPTFSFILIGLLLIFFGELIRIMSVRFAGGITRTTKVGAPNLVTEGPYSITRNPLYLGNIAIYSGIVLFAGGPLIWELLLFTFIFFILQYSMIISLEERTLTKLFGKKYKRYCSEVPRLLPKKFFWKENLDIQKPIFKTLRTEKRTLQNIFLVILFITLKYYLKMI